MSYWNERSELLKNFCLEPEIFNKYKQVAIFIQKRNDLDTCACALALAHTIKNNFDPITIQIIGCRSVSKLLRKDLGCYKDNQIDWSEDVLCVLSEICNIGEISKEDLNLIKKAKEIVFLDHHEYKTKEDQIFLEILKKEISHIKTEVFHDPKRTSVCEVLLEILRNQNEDKSFESPYWDIPNRAIELIFMGLYSDTSDLRNGNTQTFETVAYIRKKYEIDTHELIEKQTANSIRHLQLFSEAIQNAQIENRLIFVSLTTRLLGKYFPYYFYRDKNGAVKLKRQKMLTWVARWIEDLADINTIILSHYSLFKPFDQNTRFVYIILKKESPALEDVLRKHEFKNIKNRWTKEITTDDLANLVEKYKELFTS